MEQFKETFRQKQIADHFAYLQLKNLDYSDIDAAKHMGYTLNELNELKSQFSL